jgi:hypothetical protein
VLAMAGGRAPSPVFGIPPGPQWPAAARLPGGYRARMKAALHTRYGPPEVVRVVDVPTPAAKDNEVLVKVHATTVNRTDCGFRGAKPFFIRVFTGLVRPRVTILGNEFAGQIEAIGPAVTSFAVDDRVFDDDTACGAHAQYLTIREDASLARIPPVHGAGPARPEPVPGARHPAAARQVGPVRLPAARPGDDERLQEADGVRAVPTAH